MTAEGRYVHSARAPPTPSTDSVGKPTVSRTASGEADTTSFWLSTAGVAIQALAIVMIGLTRGAFSAHSYGMFGMMGYYGGAMLPYYGSGWYGAGGWLAIALIALALGILGAVLMEGGDPRRLRNGGVLVLIAAVLAFPTMWGFWIGSTLMFVGAIIALASAPSREPGSSS